MNRVEQLIQELCPNGVVHKALGEIGTFIRGGTFQRKDLLESGKPGIHYGQIHTVYSISTSKTVSFLNSATYEKARKAQPGSLVIATTSEDDEAVGKAAAWLGDTPVAVSGDAVIFEHDQDPKFVSYWFNTEEFHRQKLRYLTGTKVRRISPSNLAKMVFPVPPIEVQREIVRILDLFTELEAELEARRKQYEYYRDQLLTFPEEGGGALG